MRADVLFAVLASDFGMELVVGEGPFREPPTVMQPTIPSNPYRPCREAEAGTRQASSEPFWEGGAAQFSI